MWIGKPSARKLAIATEKKVALSRCCIRSASSSPRRSRLSVNQVALEHALSQEALSP